MSGNSDDRLEMVRQIGVLLNHGSLLGGKEAPCALTDDEILEISKLSRETLLRVGNLLQEKHAAAVNFINMAG